MSDLAAYGWSNPAPGTRLWRLRNHPNTLTHEDALTVASDLLAHIDALTAKVEALPWNPAPLDDPNDAEWAVGEYRAAVLVILRDEEV